MQIQHSIENLAHLLWKCKSQKDPRLALRHAAYLCKCGLDAHEILGNHLVCILADGGCIQLAHKVFDKLLHRHPCSFESLITGFSKCGHSQHALFLHQTIKDAHVHSSRTFVALLKACAKLKDLETGIDVHVEVARFGFLGRDLFVGSCLIDMYAKCGLLARAQQVLDKLPERNVFAWNALIGGYIQCGHGKGAIDHFENMHLDGVDPDDVTYVYGLKACGCICAIDKGMDIHFEIARKGLLEKNRLVGSNLVDMYARSGSLVKAQEVFDKLSTRDVVSWTALIRGYSEYGFGETALKYLEQMQLEGVAPDAVTYVCSLQSCASIGDIGRGQDLHAEISSKESIAGNLIVGTTLVDMYASCGVLAKAQEVFDELPVRNVVSWTSLIGGYAEYGHGEEALECFEQMQLEGIAPNTATLVCVLKACCYIGAIEKSEEIHAEIEKKGLLETDIVVGNTLLDMYAKCGYLAKAQELFEKLPSKNLVSWNALIAGYAEQGHGEDALKYFEEMQHEGFSPDAITFACGLKACGSLRVLGKGQEMHAEISAKGFLKRDASLGGALVDMYAKCGSLAKAQEVFDALCVQDAISWTALIGGYAEAGHGDNALICLEQMHHQGISPNTITLVCALKACGCTGATDKGEEIHAEIERCGFLQNDPLVGNSLIDMYAKCCLLANAHEVFNKLQVRDVVAWNALITGYAENNHGEEALKFLDQMQLEGLQPDLVTFVCSLKACGCIGAIYKGLEIHSEILKRGLLERERVVGNTLVDLYSKCGLLATAQQVFDKLPVRDIVSWNSLIAGHAQIGENKSVFNLFDRMLGEGKKPSLVTLVIVLSACSRTGLYRRSQTYFEAMTKEYGIVPTIEHHACMIDLLGRAGEVDKAFHMIKEMPCSADLVVWHTVLGACRKWGNLALGKQAFEQSVHLGEHHAGAYVPVSQRYADAELNDASRMSEATKEEICKLDGQQYCGKDCYVDHPILVGNDRFLKKIDIAKPDYLKVRHEFQWLLQHGNVKSRLSFSFSPVINSFKHAKTQSNNDLVCTSYSKDLLVMDKTLEQTLTHDDNWVCTNYHSTSFRGGNHSSYRRTNYL